MDAYEHHLHLYGCLTAEEVWSLGKNRWLDRQQALARYAKNYQTQFGIYLDYQGFWRDDNGLEKLRQCYEVHSPLTFAQFQARFDLLIALFPLLGNDRFLVWQQVLDRHQASGLRYAEYRFIFPPSEPLQYLAEVDELLLSYQRASEGKFQPRLAVSLSRQPQLAVRQYRALRELVDHRQETSISAIDLCGFEEQFPPVLYRQLWQEILADNLQRRHRLAILVHVGESYQGVSLASAMRRVLEAHLLGAHRLGHAIALGIDVDNLRGQRVGKEDDWHQQWLKDNAQQLANYGYRMRKLPVDEFYNDKICAELANFQQALLRWLADRQAIIEVCPTSNFCLGKIKEKRFHPLVNFARYQLPVTISSDDPGMFASDWWQEIDLAHKLVAKEFVDRAIAGGAQFCSQNLA